MVYHKYPKFVKTLSFSDEDYNRQCDEIDVLEKTGRIFVISPSEPVTVGRLEKDMEKLGELYHLGYDDTMNRLEELKEYLRS